MPNEPKTMRVARAAQCIASLGLEIICLRTENAALIAELEKK